MNTGGRHGHDLHPEADSASGMEGSHTDIHQFLYEVTVSMQPAGKRTHGLAPVPDPVTNTALVSLPAGCATEEMTMILPDESGSP